MSWPKPCVRCTHPIYPSSRRPPWGCIHVGRGLCGPCWKQCRAAGTLDDYRRVTYSRDELLTEWELLRLHGFSKREAADRLGMTFPAFDRAFHRARRDEDPRALPGFNDRLAA